MPIKFKIVTPERTVSEEEIYQATLPIEGGEVTLLPEHMPYIGSLQAGEILLRHEMNGEETLLATSGGFVEFHDNILVVLAIQQSGPQISISLEQRRRKNAHMPHGRACAY